MRIVGFSLAAGALLLLAGCQHGNPLSALDLTGSSKPLAKNNDAVMESELQQFCPQVDAA